MFKDKLDFKLVNCLIVFLIILVIYLTRYLWFNIFDFIINLLKPLIITIVICYIFNLYLRKLNKFFNKFVSVFIFFFTFFIFGYFIFFKLFPIFISQISDCVNIIIYFLKKVPFKFDFVDIFNRFDSFFKIISNFNFNEIVGGLFKYISLITIVITCSIYLFLDWNKFFLIFKKLCSKNALVYNYFSMLNIEFEKYVCSFFVLVVINIIEYSIIFFFVGHPNYLLLGFLAGIFSLIPIFGGMVTNCIALVTAFVINYGLFIRSLIGILVLSILDGYVVSPIIYSKGSKLHPLLIILSIYVSSSLFGSIGVVLAIPFLIVINVFLKFIKEKN